MPTQTPRPVRNKKRAFEPTPTMGVILRYLYLYHTLTVEQVMRLLAYSPKSKTRAQELFKALYDHAYVERPKPPYIKTAQDYYAKAPYMHTLTKTGLHYLEGDGFDVSFRFRPGEQKALGSGWLKHLEELNDFLITASLVPKAVPGITFDPFTDLQHEWMLRRNPVYLKVEVSQGDRSKQVIEKVIPDAWLNFGYPDGTHLPLLVEWDRGSEFREKLTRKFKALLRYTREGYYEKRFGTSFYTFAFIAPTPHRRDMLLGYCEDVLTELHLAEVVKDGVRVAALPSSVTDPITAFFTPRWHRPFDYEKSGNARSRVKVYNNPLPLLDMS